MSIKVELWGDFACFTRPEMKVERVSYDVITPSAARGVLEAIYWHPGMKWIIDKIYVLSPIRFTNIKRNEVKSKISANTVFNAAKNNQHNLYISTSSDIAQKATMALKNVHYVVEAHFEMTDKASDGDNPGKFQDIIKRRLAKGQCYHQPYFGTREFIANFRQYEFSSIPTDSSLQGERDLGYMLYDDKII